MGNRPALALLALCALAMLLASCFDAAPLRWLGGLSAATFPVALIALGAARGGRIGGLRWPLVLLWIVLAGSWIVLLALPHGGPDAGALPLGTALMLFVMVPAPFAIVCWAYASRFDLSEEDLERIRRLGRHDQGEE
ncbi:MAG TPA: hypothetical protein VF756_30220 [Thermoanaerobaculia bacterium]